MRNPLFIQEHLWHVRIQTVQNTSGIMKEGKSSVITHFIVYVNSSHPEEIVLKSK